MWTKESVKRGYGQPLYKEQSADMKDFSSLIMEAKSAGAEILLTGPTTPQGITLTKQLKELDYAPKFYFAYRAPDPMAWTQALGKDGDYVVLGPGWTSGLKYPGVDKLNESLYEEIQPAGRRGSGSRLRVRSGLGRCHRKGRDARQGEDQRRYRLHKHEDRHWSSQIPA